MLFGPFRRLLVIKMIWRSVSLKLILLKTWFSAVQSSSMAGDSDCLANNFPPNCCNPETWCYTSLQHYKRIIELVRNKMTNLRKHHRIQIPNSLAMFAVLLLIISTVAGVETNKEAVTSGQESRVSVKADDTSKNVVKSKSSGLKLGLLLFRRG